LPDIAEGAAVGAAATEVVIISPAGETIYQTLIRHNLRVL
jgi:hypothetical protein